MTKYFKQWLTDHGITAASIAEKLNMTPTHLYGELNGKYPVSPRLHDILINTYGMTEAEYAEAIGCVLRWHRSYIRRK